MADGSVAGVISLQGKVSAEEWQARVDLAALYRLVALYGWDDLIYTHISARIPGPDHHFLINPYGLLFEEITASSLVKIDLDGNILQETPYFIIGFYPPKLKTDKHSLQNVSPSRDLRLSQHQF